MKSLLIFVAGLIAGAAVAFVIWGIPLRRHVANQFLLSALDQAYIGVQLHQSRGPLIEPWIRRTLPDYVREIGRNPSMQGNPMAQETLWMIREYYRQGNYSPPFEIVQLLETAPDESPETCRRMLDNMDSAANAMARQSEISITLTESNRTDSTVP